MADTAQIDKIISEVNNLDEKGKIILFHKMEELLDNSNEPDDENIPIESAFGLWKNRNITTEQLRQKAWKRN